MCLDLLFFVFILFGFCWAPWGIECDVFLSNLWNSQSLLIEVFFLSHSHFFFLGLKLHDFCPSNGLDNLFSPFSLQIRSFRTFSKVTHSSTDINLVVGPNNEFSISNTTFWIQNFLFSCLKSFLPRFLCWNLCDCLLVMKVIFCWGSGSSGRVPA
jgi:hypothetical protein